MTADFELNEDHLAPLLDSINQLDLSEPQDAATQLNEQYPLTNTLIEVKTAMLAGVENKPCHKGEAPVQFSRLKRTPTNIISALMPYS